jgi:hypothetical protein
VIEIDVRCVAFDGGWRCAVTVGDDRDTSRHEVTVSTADAVELAAADDELGVERLVEESFDFLLEREPKESILSAFDIRVIGRYFPDYEHEIRSRLAP